MLLRSCLKDALNVIDTPHLVRDETVVPAQCPRTPNSTYRSGYDWLFWYERKLAHFLEPWLKAFRHELIGEKGILCEALSNAFCHGHKKDPSLAIGVRVFLGRKGLLIQIRDQGAGFDVQTAYNRYIKGKAYYHIAGNGMRTMAESNNFAVFYNESGTMFHLIRMFNGKMETIAPFTGRPAKEMGEQRPMNRRGMAFRTGSQEKQAPFKFVDPPEVHSWVQGAVLADRHYREIVAFGITSGKARALLAQCRSLFEAAQSICSQLDVGYTESLWIQSSTGSIWVGLIPENARLVLMVLNREATPAQAQFYQSHIVTHLITSP